MTSLTRRRRHVRAGHVMALLTAASLTVAGQAAGAGTGGTELQRGLRYESAPDDAQRVGFWVVGPPVDGETTLAFNVRVRCKKLHGDGSFLVRVGDDGKLRGKGAASSAEPEDGPATDGEVTVEGEVASDGTARGTVSFELVQHNEQDSGDVYDRCKSKRAEWTVAAGVPDPAIARVAGFVELSSELRDADFDALAADDDAVYLTTSDRGGQDTLHRVIADTGKVDWSTDLGQLAVRDAVVGAGFAWVSGEVDGRPTVRQLSLDDGDEVATVRGSDVAVGPAGDVWVATFDGHELRRIDPESGKVAATLPVPGTLGEQVEVGADGVYAIFTPEGPIGRSPAPVLARFNPASGAILAEHEADDLSDLIVEPSSVWLQSPDGEIRFDPRTLAELARSDEYGLSFAAALPGLWIGGFDGVAALGPTGTTDVFIPWLFGAVVASGSTVWLVEHDLGLVRIDVVARRAALPGNGGHARRA